MEGINDKRQITAVFGGSIIGDVLPVQLVYEGTTPRCYPSKVDFLADWLISSTSNHWRNEETMLFYGTAQFKLDKARVWHVLDMTFFSFRTRAGMHALTRSMM